MEEKMALGLWTVQDIQHHALAQQLQDLIWHRSTWGLLKLAVLMLVISSAVFLDPTPLQK